MLDYDDSENAPLICLDFVDKLDWTVSAHNLRFGISELDYGGLEADVLDAWGGRTKIHFGPSYLRTNLTTFEVLTIAGVASVVLIAAVSFVIARCGPRQGPAA